MEKSEVLVIGAGVAGMSAALFTARAGFSTRLINCGSSILNRNAHLENYPGFPDGIDPRLLLAMMQDQVESTGAVLTQSAVTEIEGAEPLEVSAGGEVHRGDRVILTCWSDVDPVADLDVRCFRRNNKTFIETDESGETSVRGLYAAGRLTGTHHQTIVSAGDGARVGLNVIRDLDPEFYHDWVVPEGYFTDRGREVPRGCEEVSEAERQRRSERGRRTLIDYLQSAETADPTPHPSQGDGDDSG